MCFYAVGHHGISRKTSEEQKRTRTKQEEQEKEEHEEHEEHEEQQQ